MLESADALNYQIIFNSHPKTLRDAYFAETGELKIRHFIAKRRLMYYHNILRRGENEAVKKIFKVQQFRYIKYDFYQIIKEEKEKYEIFLNDEEVT